MLGEQLKCSWCGRLERECKAMVACPTLPMAICDECVELCVELIADHKAEKARYREEYFRDRKE